MEEEKTQEFVADPARGAEDGWQEVDIVTVSICRVKFRPSYGLFLQQLDYVVRRGE